MLAPIRCGVAPSDQAREKGNKEVSEEERTLNEAEAQLLRHEAYMARLLKHRSAATPASSAKPTWQRFLESSGGTALITVVLGGIFGALISGMIQSSAKDRDFQQSWLKARGDQALEAYKEHLAKQQETVRKVYERIGVSISSAEDLIAITRPEFSAASYEGEQRQAIEKYRKDVMDTYNTNEAEWRKERDILGLLMNYYHPKQDAVISAWQGTRDSVTAFLRCAEEWRNAHPLVEDTSVACQTERKTLTARLNDLSASLETSRTYAWEGWESPEKLRQQLAKQ